MEYGLLARGYCIFCEVSSCVLSEMEITKECYRFFIEALCRNGSTPSEIYKLLYQAWKDEAPSQATVYKLFSEFSSGTRNSFHDSVRSGRPTSSCSQGKCGQSGWDSQGESPHYHQRIGARNGHQSWIIIYTILSVNLQLTSMCSPHALTVEQKQQRVSMAKEWLRVFSEFNEVDLLNQIVIVDEKYFFHRTLGRKLSNHAWCIGEEDRPRVPRRVMHDQKSHVIVASSFCGRYHLEVMEKGQTVNSEKFMAFLQDMHDKFVHKRNSLGWKKMLLIMDNARPHNSRATVSMMSAKAVRLLRQPPYSPDFNFNDRWVFSKLEELREKVNFESADHLEEFLHEAMQGLNKATLRTELERLKRDLKDVIDVGGDYL